jgi:hypothetical protein
MSNSQYLTLSYFLVAAGSLVIGGCAVLWLWKPLREFAAALPWKAFGRFLVRLFPLGILLPAFLGFVSVSYYGCNVDTYEKVVANRKYLEDKNLEQISASLFYVVYAVIVWCVILAVVVALKKRGERNAPTVSSGNE